jgi:hypothetical protein
VAGLCASAASVDEFDGVAGLCASAARVDDFDGVAGLCASADRIAEFDALAESCGALDGVAGLCARAERIDEFDPPTSPRGRSGASRRADARVLGHAVAVARRRLRAAAGARVGARAAACVVFFRISRAPSLRSVRALAQPAPAAASSALAQAPPPVSLDWQSVER